MKPTSSGCSTSLTTDTRRSLPLPGRDIPALAVTEAPGGYRLTPSDPEFERQRILAEEIMHDDRDVLRALSK